MKFNFFVLIFFLLSYNLTFADIKTNYLIINKSSRKLVIFLNNGEIKNFSISLGFEPFGTKVKKGDGKTPEGLYYIENKIKDACRSRHFQSSTCSNANSVESKN